jgi:hypothetical protein
MSWRCKLPSKEERFDKFEDDEDDDQAKKANDKGEVMHFMRDIEEESRSMMQDLTQIDNMLLSLKERVEEDRADRRELLRVIESIRLRIGVLEKEDRIEINEEEVAESLLSKLKKWVDQVV